MKRLLVSRKLLVSPAGLPLPTLVGISRLFLAALAASGVVNAGIAAPKAAASSAPAVNPGVATPNGINPGAASPDGKPDEAAAQGAAMALLQAGKRADALEAFERIIAQHPQDPTIPLFEASAIALDLNKWQEAKPYVRRLVKLRPGSMQAWEMLVQVEQAEGDKTGQRDAMDRMYSAWRSALDPVTRQRAVFTRDRIFGPKRTVIVQQTLEPGGDNIVRWFLAPIDQLDHPAHYLIVRSDDETNERWRESGTASYGTVVYHLDAVQILPNGQARSVPYEFYLNEPDYDQVRTKVAAILSGEAKPLSGEADPFWTGEADQSQ
jgi:tetratricopeptide (TPR) repeat protein